MTNDTRHIIKLVAGAASIFGFAASVALARQQDNQGEQPYWILGVVFFLLLIITILNWPAWEPERHETS